MQEPTESREPTPLGGAEAPSPETPDLPSGDAGPASVPAFTIKRPILGAVEVFADGVPLQKKGFFGSTYLLPMPDGTTRDLQLRGYLTGARVVFDGMEHRLEPSPPAWAWVLAVIPLVLLIGGAFGGLFGALGLVFNLRVATSRANAATKIGAMVLISAIAIGLWLTVAALLRGPAPSRADVAIGDCVNGIRPNTQQVTNSIREVACTTAHDVELIGQFDLADGPYPGRPALDPVMESGCVAAFEAYVGVSPYESEVGVLPVFPNESSWNAGDRTVFCFASRPDGRQITGSLRRDSP